MARLAGERPFLKRVSFSGHGGRLLTGAEAQISRSMAPKCHPQLRTRAPLTKGEFLDLRIDAAVRLAQSRRGSRETRESKCGSCLYRPRRLFSLFCRHVALLTIVVPGSRFCERFHALLTLGIFTLEPLQIPVVSFRSRAGVGTGNANVRCGGSHLDGLRGCGGDHHPDDRVRRDFVRLRPILAGGPPVRVFTLRTQTQPDRAFSATWFVLYLFSCRSRPLDRLGSSAIELRRGAATPGSAA